MATFVICYYDPHVIGVALLLNIAPEFGVQ